LWRGQCGAAHRDTSRDRAVAWNPSGRTGVAAAMRQREREQSEERSECGRLQTCHAFASSSCLFRGEGGNIGAMCHRVTAMLGILGVAVSLSCGESATAPARFGPPAALQIVTGDAQTGSAGQALPEPLTIQVLDAAGHGLRGLTG